MTRSEKVRFWLIGFVVFGLLLWLLNNVLLPFAAAAVLAYVFSPLVRWLGRIGLPRWLGSCLVLLAFTLFVTAVLFLVVPLISSQVAQLVEVLPAYAKLSGDHLYRFAHRMVRYLSPEDVERLRTAVSSASGEVVSWVVGVLRGVLSGGLALFDVLSILFIMPVVAFYLLRDWDRLVQLVDSWLPREHYQVIRDQVLKVDHTLSGYIRGQVTVCLMLAIYYAASLSLAGLNFGLTVGLVAGMVTFIPYVGSLVGLVSGLGIALGQFDSLWSVGLVAVVFLVGQTLEGYVLTPRLVGGNVGLHPVWVMFALLAGARLFGFVGVLLALPIAAVIGVLLRFALGRYLASPLYYGLADDPGAGSPADGPVPRR